MNNNKHENNKKSLQGIVISNLSNKSITVKIQRTIKHKKYKKYIKKSSNIYAHDEHNTCKIGNIVNIITSKSYSKTKKWRLLKIIK